MCAFAARTNRRRGFLLVSKVLGRHLPTRPSVMRSSSAALASLLPADLPGPVLFIGMAETAICLGQSVHSTWTRKSGRCDSLYLHSTRQMIGKVPLIRFSEPHSHAESHLLYAPAPNAWKYRLEDIASLVLVDDEITTGKTFANLAEHLVPLLPRLKQIEICVLTDWTDGGGALEAMPFSTTSHSLLKGTFEWHWERGEAADPAGNRGNLGRLQRPPNFGREGTPGLEFDLDHLCAVYESHLGSPLHLIGTGELHYPTFLLGEALEARGHDVLVQATTRSPARLGGAISAIQQLRDNYETEVPNYLYNADQTKERLRIVCHETGPNSLDPSLIRKGDFPAVDFGALL
ncbi:phosphoribosyltransferase domain-containing protein [Novosphingobium indicum]|nr:phosphoribosyltransferase domain-containing protein [Novosphingobium indicum]